MATSPRSPKTPNKFDYPKDDSPGFWEKLGTLGRNKKKFKEGEDCQKKLN